jgi:hypothetical protein
MTPGELYTLFRNDAMDHIEPYLWSDAEIYAYINDAYFMFVRRTGGIPDVTSVATQLTITAGEATTDLHPSVMRVRQAVLDSTNRELDIINVHDIAFLSDEDYGVLRRAGRVDTPGQVTHMVIGEGPRSVRWIQVPAVDDSVSLVIERLPLTPIIGALDEFTDVREEHHFHLLKWVRHLAYRKQDPDTFDLLKSDQEAADFFAYCDFAQKEKDIRKHKVRVVQYGGL